MRKFCHIRRGFSSNLTVPSIPLNFPYFLTVYAHWYMNRRYKRCRGDRDVLCLHTSPYISGLMWYCPGIWSPHLCGRTHLHVCMYIVHLYEKQTRLSHTLREYGSIRDYVYLLRYLDFCKFSISTYHVHLPIYNERERY